MTPRDGNTALRYLDASRVEGPTGQLGSVGLRSMDDRKIGALDGLLIEPTTRRVRFFVVQSPGWFGTRRYLLPSELPAQICDRGRAMRVDVGSEELVNCPPFDPSSVPAFSDDDLLDALFPRRVA